MHKIKSKQLRKLAVKLYNEGMPENTTKRIYRQLKYFYNSGYLPKDLRITDAK